MLVDVSEGRLGLGPEAVVVGLGFHRDCRQVRICMKDLIINAEVSAVRFLVWFLKVCCFVMFLRNDIYI